MLIKKMHWFVGMAIVLAMMTACGQMSMGVVTVTPAENEVIVEPVEETQEATPEPEITMEPVEEDTPEEEAHAIPTIAYIGMDGNLFVLEAGADMPHQLTSDFSQMGGEGNSVEYSWPALSSDGMYLAFRKDLGVPFEGGYDVTSALWVVNLDTGEMREIFSGTPAGFAWKPGTHLLAHGIGVAFDYFMNRGQPDAAFANGLRGIDVDTGESMDLVLPERGFALYGPKWSSDGRFLAFAEVIGMEGSGNFAYYDFVSQQYYSWEEPVGEASWSPNGGLLTYARHTYAASGEERIYLRPRDGVEQTIGPDYEGPAYATAPVFSPSGDRIAYLAYLEGPETNAATVMVLDIASGEFESVGSFEGSWQLAWVADGSHLILQGGPYESSKIYAINLADGSQTVLAEGRWPTVAGQ